ncbi:hypothetical protein BLA29_005157 [Euroglyphus maynei]|uniref:Uncharacterized protein n=1 Tax=Euroglyphus maynei TaxID=6958 RepID=A0A1Y3BTI0_EURMA|nr:hypothetical protein BLA29_005157 [Euroglyphus maynei]
MTDHSTRRPLTLQIDKPKWYNHNNRQQSYVNGNDNVLSDYSFNKYSYNDKMTITPLIIKKYNVSSANVNDRNIQSEITTSSPPLSTTTLIKPLTTNTNLLIDYDFSPLPFRGGGDDDNSHGSSHNSPFPHLSNIPQSFLPLTLPPIRESLKPKSKMDKFLPFSLMNIKDRLINNWNQNFFHKKHSDKDSNKILMESMDSRKMDFLIPKSFKRFRTLFSRSSNYSGN